MESAVGKDSWGREGSVINVEEMDVHETQDLDEIQVYKEIWNELGISPVGWDMFPKIHI